MPFTKENIMKQVLADPHIENETRSLRFELNEIRKKLDIYHELVKSTSEKKAIWKKHRRYMFGAILFLLSCIVLSCAWFTHWLMANY